MTTGVKTLKLTGAAESPVLAPSSACARQKYVRSALSGCGSRKLVCPLLPAATPVCVKTLDENAESEAISKTYVNGRTPVDVELPTIKVMGCCSNETWAPEAGCMSLGAEMVTPAIGPATDGLVGLALFSCAQAASRSTGSSKMVKRT